MEVCVDGVMPREAFLSERLELSQGRQVRIGHRCQEKRTEACRPCNPLHRRTRLVHRVEGAQSLEGIRALEQPEASGCPHCLTACMRMHGNHATKEFASNTADDSGDQLAEHLRLAATKETASPFTKSDEQLVIAQAAVQTVACQARARRSERPAVERPFGRGAEALDECEQTLARQRRSSQPERTSEPQHGVQRVVAELDEAELRLLVLPRRRLLWNRRWLRRHRLRRHLLLAGRLLLFLLLLRSHRLLGLLLKLCALLTDRLFLPRRRERLLLLLQLELALVGVSPDEMRALGGHVAGDLVARHGRAHASCAHFGQLEHLANEATG
eukprot:scaffold39598_cov72-Phaeocystis_antarctica.AAC.4